MTRIRFTNLLAERIGGIHAAEVSAATVESALHMLTERYPELKRLLWTDEGTVNPVMAIFLNDRQLGAHEFAAAVEADDEIDIVPAVEGGFLACTRDSA